MANDPSKPTAIQRARRAIEDNPGKTIQEWADIAGVDRKTIDNARAQIKAEREAKS